MRILICGSRTWNDIHVISAAMANFPGDTVVIHGGAQGADSIAQDIADLLNLKTEVYPVTKEQWKTYGKAAGPLRNARMLHVGKPDYVIAFRSHGVSRGTDDMIAQAEHALVPVQVVFPPS